MRELLNLLKNKDSAQRTEPGPNDNEMARSLAEWSLLQFTSAPVKVPKRSIIPRRFFNRTNIEEMMEPKSVILRIEGSIVHRPQEYFWFIGVPLHTQVHFFSVNSGNTNMLTLSPSVEGYRIVPTRTMTMMQAKHKFPIHRTLDEILNRKYSDHYTRAERIDVMYGGIPEEVNELNRSRQVPDLQGAII